MSAELTYFTVTGNWYDVEAANLGGSSSNLQFLMISGFVAFYPRLPAGWAPLVSNLDLGSGASGNTYVALPPILGRIYRGQLSTIDYADTVGVQLVSNSSVISSQIATVATHLVYDVQFSDVVYNGGPQHILPFSFIAPTDSTGVCLTDPNLTKGEYLGPGA